MTSTDTTIDSSTDDDNSLKGWLAKIESWMDGASDRLNPILVKESRQALKSRQFVITFTLLLICAVLWSLFAVAQLTPAIYYAPAGKYLLIGYCWIMLFPLVVIVPFSAFRSLATERDDGTYELLTITTLKARQIVSGKLGSSVLQMVVYLSALAPCIAFTYLLRGVDVALILFAIVGTFMLSILLSVAGLLLATLANARHLQVVLSVILILSLAGVFFYVGIFNTVFLFQEFFSLSDPDTLYVVGGFATAWACLLALMYLAAAARIQFISDNRSTPLRVAMFVSGLCIIGWCVWYGLCWGLEEGVELMVGFSMLYWWIMGSFMVGERPELSPRVRRKLPATFLGRVGLTWFQPGPGAGYFFAVSNMATCSFVAIAIFLYSMRLGQGWDRDWIVTFSFVAVCYVAAYLGLGRLVARLIRRRGEGPLLSFLTQLVLLFVGGILFPMILQYSLFGNSLGYTAIQVSNPFWTLDDGFDRGSAQLANGWFVASVVLACAAGVILLVNFVLLARDLLPVRTAVPERVVEELLSVVQPANAATTRPKHPWDVGP